MVTFSHKGLLHCSIERRGRHLCGGASPLVGGIPASVDPFGAPASVAGLAESDDARPPMGRALAALVLAHLRVQSPSAFLTALSFVLLVEKNFPTRVRAATVNSSEESGLHFGGDSERVASWRTRQPLISRICDSHIWTQRTSLRVALL